MTEARTPRVGELRRRFSLGSEAVYRVCSVDRRFVEVEVVRAPGLSAGRRFRFALRAVADMSLVAGPSGPEAAEDTGDSAGTP